MLAPIVVFAFNRLDLLRKTISSLSANLLSESSDLYVFVDGPRTFVKGEDEKVTCIQKYVRTISGFKSVHYFFSSVNKGLATSIIEGITYVITKYGKIIVVEDDLVLSGSFLIYMNQMLDKYEHEKKIFQITGFGLKIKKPLWYSADIYFHNRANSWGWATWDDRWRTVDWEISDYNAFITNKQRIKAFNKGGSDLVKMLREYKKGKNSSWYIRFDYAMFSQNKLAVTPIKSLVINEGFITESTHCNVYNRYKVDFEHDIIKSVKVPEKVELNLALSNKYYSYYSITARITGKIMTFKMKLFRWGLFKR